jgi:hypothetical protein
MEAGMQLHLPMLTVYEGPRLVSQEILAGVLSYRDAVRTCWDLRTRRNLTKRVLAEETGLYPSHVSDYLSELEWKRELPAKHINLFEVSCGNRVITQWHNRQANLTILEQFIESRRAAA